MVFVGNLSYDTTEQELRSHFTAHDTPGVESVQIEVLANGRSRGWCLVEFDSPNNAQGAIELLNGTEIHDRRMKVRLDRK